MLEQLRRNSRSFIIWILFIIIIAAFVLTFGSQGGLQMDCGGGRSTYVMDVDGSEVSVHSWRFGMATLQGAKGNQRNQLVLDQLLLREILALAADKAGFRVTDDLVNDHIKRGKIWVFGNAVDGRNLFMEEGLDESGNPTWLFNYERFEAVVRSWNVPSVELFIREQRRELLAELMRGAIIDSAAASADEARARFEYQNTTAAIDAVTFRSSEYRRRLVLTPEEVGAYLADHDEDVRKRYEQDERLYKEVKPQARLRQIEFARQAPPKPAAPTPGTDDAAGAGAPGDGKADEAKPGDAKPGAGADKPGAAQDPDPGLLAARAAHKRLVEGADFATLAAEVSEDERTKRKGGDLGWRSLERPGLGGKELSDAVGKLEKGGFSEVIETPRGFFILFLEDKREGDLGYDQVKLEIAERLAVEYYAGRAAKSDAQAALQEARTTGKKLADLFERQTEPPPGPGFDPSQLDNLTPEQRKQIEELLRRSQEQGALGIESRDIPAESTWQGAEPIAAGDEPAPAKPAAAAGSAADKVVLPEAEAKSGEAPAAGADTVDELLVKPDNVPKPQVRKIGPFQRDADGNVGNLGESKEMVKAIFDDLSEGDLGPRVYEVGKDFVIFQVVARKNPDPAEFTDEEKTRILRGLDSERGYGLYRDWVSTRCNSLVKAKKVGLNNDLLKQLSEDSKKPFTYQACTYIR